MSFCFSLFLVKKAKYPKGLLINVNGCYLSLWLLFRLPLLSEYSHGFYKLFPLYIQAIEGFLNFVQKMRQRKKKKNCYYIKPLRCSFKKETLFFFFIQLSNKYIYAIQQQAWNQYILVLQFIMQFIFINMSITNRSKQKIWFSFT